jgi:hypothetical protein
VPAIHRLRLTAPWSWALGLAIALVPRRSNLQRTDEFATLCGATVGRVDDLVRLGLGRSTIAHRCCTGGPWRRMLPRVVKLNNGPSTRADWRRAALLHAGHRAVLTGLDALERHGIERMPRPSGPVHVLVPSKRRRSGSGRLIVERTERLPSAGSGRRPLYDHTGRFIATPDVWFDDVGMAWEIDSTERHLSPADYERTLDRHAAMTAANVVVLLTRPSRVVHRSQETLDDCVARITTRPAARHRRSLRSRLRGSSEPIAHTCR